LLALPSYTTADAGERVGYLLLGEGPGMAMAVGYGEAILQTISCSVMVRNREINTNLILMSIGGLRPPFFS